MIQRKSSGDGDCSEYAIDYTHEDKTEKESKEYEELIRNLLEPNLE